MYFHFIHFTSYYYIWATIERGLEVTLFSSFMEKSTHFNFFPTPRLLFLVSIVNVHVYSQSYKYLRNRRWEICKFYIYKDSDKGISCIYVWMNTKFLIVENKEQNKREEVRKCMYESKRMVTVADSYHYVLILTPKNFR
jgi:hypothetical protein